MLILESFNLAYEEYKLLASKAKIQAAASGAMGAGGRRPVKGDFSPVAMLGAGRRKAGMAGDGDGWDVCMGLIGDE